MRSRVITLAVAAVSEVFALIGLGAARAQSDNLIVPGVRIGRTHLGPNGTTFLSRLPKPDAADAAMSHLREVWVSRRKGREPETLFLAMTRNGALDVAPKNGLTIEDIRVTSPAYHLSSGLHTGDTLAKIRRRYPNLRPADTSPSVYADLAHGIAFEFAGGLSPSAASRCIAIHVVTPNGGGNIAVAKQVDAVLGERHR